MMLMECKEFNKNIDSFINDKMDEDLYEDFINHYNTCKNCNEELGIYYLAHKIFSNSPDLDNKSNEKYNLSDSINEFISKKEEIIYKNYRYNYFHNMMFWIGNGVSIAVAMYFLYLLFKA